MIENCLLFSKLQFSVVQIWQVDIIFERICTSFRVLSVDKNPSGNLNNLRHFQVVFKRMTTLTVILRRPRHSYIDVKEMKQRV